MAEKNIKWTTEQKAAITARGSDVLVSASAGTGKTAVLSGRCVDIVSDKNVCPDVRNLLVLTFTEAAAEQMKSRIAGQLKAAYLKSGQKRLRHQLILLQGANISTIHSFCKRLITEHFYKLGLDPTFTIIDGDEQKLLKAETIEKCIDWAWQQSHLRQGLEQLLRRRDLRTNDGFLSKIISLSEFLDGVISRDRWYLRAAELAEAVNPFTSQLGEKQKKIVEEKLTNILDQIQYAQKLYIGEKPDGNWASKWQDCFVEPVSGSLKFLRSGDWGRCAESIRNYQKPSRFEYKPRGLDGPIADVIKNTAENAKKTFEKLIDLAVLNPDYLDKVGGSVGLQTKIVVELVKKFDRLYAETKRQFNCLDFADLEHYALKLLDSDISADQPQPSQTALMLRRKYKYIFVDEYQDINPVQQRILELLSCGDNIFIVGDVKQSIYAFRGAKSDDFLKRLKSASANPAETEKGFRVNLNANFRSAKGILDFVNQVFSRIMTEAFANINYNKSAMLRASDSASSCETKNPIVELHILDEHSAEIETENDQEAQSSQGSYTSRQKQAAMIARRIRQMVGADTGQAEFEIYDKDLDKNRSVEYRDIVILMRSPANRINDYVQVLRLADIPISGEVGSGYFEATEISDCMSLLKVLDNPKRDIELAAVLRSPFFKVSDSELARIRIHSKTNNNSGDFYQCVLEYRANGPDAKLCQKIKATLERIEKWRTAGRRGKLADLIWQIYRGTGFLSFVSALPNGTQRRANLLELHDRAIQFEGFVSSNKAASLTRFVEFVEKLQQSGRDWASAEPEAQMQTGVRIISVHKSKGLEFPVVFLAELNSRFNNTDSTEDCLAEASDTLGLQIIDARTNSKLSSLAHQVIAEHRKKTALAEEMRILYVAMTRARDRLILSGCEKKDKGRQIICDGYYFGDGPASNWQLERCQNPLQWVLYGLCDQKDMHDTFETSLDAKAKNDDLFSFRLYSREALDELTEYLSMLKAAGEKRIGSAAKKTKTKESKLLSKIKSSLNWQYEFSDIQLLPAKQSVSAITHRDDEFRIIDYTRALERRPQSISPDTLDSRLVGTATHLVISRLDLAGPVTKQMIEKTIEELIAQQNISQAAAQRIDTESILAFFNGRLGQLILDKQNCRLREWPFTFAMPVSQWKDSALLPNMSIGTQDTIIVQGIIDMLIQTPDGLVIIDFKTDNVTAGKASERAENYVKQLQLYSRAAESILKTRTIAKWLYFLKPGKAIEIQ